MSNEQLSTLSAGNLEHSLATAQQLSKSDLLPPHFRNKPENVLIALTLAKDLGLNPVQALSNISVVSGKPCLQSALMISLLAQKGCLKGPLRFRYEGKEGQPDFRCQAYGIDRETGETVEGLWISMAHAQAEGWTRNPKYKTLPALMLQYRAAAFFVRGFYPSCILGLQTTEEVQDVEFAEREVGPSTADKIKAAVAAKKEAQPEPTVEAEVLPPEVPQISEELQEVLKEVDLCADGMELLGVMEASKELPEIQKKAVWNAIQSKANDLGLEYQKSFNQFTTKE